MPTSSYDVVVVYGNDIAGLITATLCARRGSRVLLLRTQKRPYSYQLGNQTVPRRAAPLVGLSAPAVTRVLEELHFEHVLRRKLRQNQRALQIVGA